MGDTQHGRTGVILLVVLAVVLAVLAVGVVLPRSGEHDDRWTTEEAVVAHHARARVRDMLSANGLQPAVTVALHVEVLETPEELQGPLPAMPCPPHAAERSLLANVEAKTLFGVTLWTYEVSCTSSLLVDGI